MVGFEYSIFKIGVLYLQWTKRTGKQKTPKPPSPFSLQRIPAMMSLRLCHQPKAEDDDPEPTQKAKG